MLLDRLYLGMHAAFKLIDVTCCDGDIPCNSIDILCPDNC